MELEKILGLGCFVVGSLSVGLGIYCFFKDRNNRYILSNLFSYIRNPESNKIE